MGFSKEFFPIKVFPKGHGFFLIIKVFSPRGVFPKGPADRRPRKGHLPRQAPERKQRVFLKIGFSQNKTQKRPPTPQTRNERPTTGAEAANYKEQVFPNTKWVFPKRFSQQKSGFFQNKRPT